MSKPRSSYTTEQSLRRFGEAISKALTDWASRGDATDMWRTCHSCAHMRKEGAAFCTKFNVTPPIAVIVGIRDCEAYKDDEEIPF